MKLILCGKGGSGKSTVTALLARELAARGGRVVVVDTDLSNAGLHRLLGTAPSPDLMGHFGGKEAVRKFVEDAQELDEMPEAPALGTWTYDNLPVGFHATADGVRLVSIGKILDATEGCTCTQYALTRRFILGLRLGPGESALIDTEAGVEHFGRGVDALCDAVLMVIDPSYESICLVPKVRAMADEVGIPLYYALNKVDVAAAASLRRALPDIADRIVGEFPADPGVVSAGLEGRPVAPGHPAAGATLSAVRAALAGVRG